MKLVIGYIYEITIWEPEFEDGYMEDFYSYQMESESIELDYSELDKERVLKLEEFLKENMLLNLDCDFNKELKRKFPEIKVPRFKMDLSGFSIESICLR